MTAIELPREYNPQNDDVLLISRPYGYGECIGYEVNRYTDRWLGGRVMDGGNAESVVGTRTLIHHHEFEPGWFYWIYRQIEPVNDPRMSASEIMANNHGRLVFD